MLAGSGQGGGGGGRGEVPGRPGGQVRAELSWRRLQRVPPPLTALDASQRVPCRHWGGTALTNACGSKGLVLC